MSSSAMVYIVSSNFKITEGWERGSVVEASIYK